MNVGTRYPEGRIGRPREIGGRHVRKEEKGLRKGGPEGLRKAHEARAGHGPEDAGAQGVVQGDREGAGQVALDGVSVNIFFTIFTNVFSPIAPTRMRRIRQRGCAAFGV